jgi:cell wall-associated NlpC family hydrolase
MKWMIATTLVGSAAFAPVAITTENMGNQFSAITNEVRSIDPTTSGNISDVAISSEILLEEWDTLSPEQQAEWQTAHDTLVQQADAAHDNAVRDAKINKLNNVVKEVVNQVGKTPYILSGDTPSGWDCSGLVKWMYSKLGIDLPHSASAQLYVGHPVAHPRKGDIVVWGGGYHSGIYLGNGKAVHAYNYYRDTIITKVSEVAGTATFIRAYNY